MPTKSTINLPSASEGEDELESEEDHHQDPREETPPVTVNEMIQGTIAECPTAGECNMAILQLYLLIVDV